MKFLYKYRTKRDSERILTFSISYVWWKLEKDGPKTPSRKGLFSMRSNQSIRKFLHKMYVKSQNYTNCGYIQDFEFLSELGMQTNYSNHSFARMTSWWLKIKFSKFGSSLARSVRAPSFKPCVTGSKPTGRVFWFVTSGKMIHMKKS